jgi:hypothetical protein
MTVIETISVLLTVAFFGVVIVNDIRKIRGSEAYQRLRAYLGFGWKAVDSRAVYHVQSVNEDVDQYTGYRVVRYVHLGTKETRIVKHRNLLDGVIEAGTFGDMKGLFGIYDQPFTERTVGIHMDNRDRTFWISVTKGTRKWRAVAGLSSWKNLNLKTLPSSVRFNKSDLGENN